MNAKTARRRHEPRELTQDELWAEAKARFGDDPLDVAFECTSCGDVATIREFKEAGDAQLAGQGCIGRLLGALEGGPTRDGGRSRAKRGCDWAAFGLFPGPWLITLPNGRAVRSFPLAPATVKAGETQ